MADLARSKCCFSPGLKLFSTVSADNRIHLWDTESAKARKGSYVDKNHLSHACTCLAWSCSGSGNSTEKSKLGFFAMGFNDGQLLVWDLSRGIVIKNIQHSSGAAPVSIVFGSSSSSDSPPLYVSIGDKHVYKYNIKTGDIMKALKVGKKTVSKIALNPKLDVIAVASGAGIKLIDVETGRKKKMDESIPGGVRSMTFSSCGRFLIVASIQDNDLLVFDVSADADTTPAYVIALSSAVVTLEARTRSSQLNSSSLNGNGKIKTKGKNKPLSGAENGDIVEILAIFEDRNGCIVRVAANYEQYKSKNLEPVFSFTHIVSDNSLLDGYLTDIKSNNDSGVVLAHGQYSSPSFTRFQITNPETGDFLTELKVNDKRKDVLEDKQVAGEMFLAPDVLGPNQTGGTKRPLVDKKDGEESRKAKKGEASQSSKVSKDDELTLEQRLESMSNKMSELEESIVNDAYTITEEATSDSLVTLIEQALQSGDDALLEQCLQSGDIDVIDATARQLPTNRIVFLLKKLVAKFEKRPSRGILVTRWLSSVLRHHTSYLVTVPDLSFQLAGLGQMLEQRLSSYMRLSSLAGRLDLLLSQLSYSEKKGDNQTNRNTIPQAIYQEE